METSKPTSAIEKALKINLDPSIYGTIAEIGAGQEVARNFFVAGGAAGTIAKTMSAYDMNISDAIYGKEPDGRYVSRSRLEKMMEREYNLLVERLELVRASDTIYFAFADTVVAKGYKSDRDCHGWMGIRFQHSPLSSHNSIVLHVRMKDDSNVQQQQALGILGINLIYGAFYLRQEPETLISSLLDGLSTSRIEIDMIKFDGNFFQDVDNRLMALHLVQSGLTHSVFFTSDGNPVQAYDLLYKKDVMVLRGSFRPFTLVHMDMYNTSINAWKAQAKEDAGHLVFLTELSMSHLMAFGSLDKSDFLGRIDTLCGMGFDVQISDFSYFFQLKMYLSQFTKNPISFVLGIKNIAEIFSPDRFTEIPGSIVYSLSQLFSGSTRIFVYPKLLKTGEIRQVSEMSFETGSEYLFQHYLKNGLIYGLQNIKPELLSIFTKDIRDEISVGSKDWSAKVPEQVFRIVTEKKLFGYK